MMARTIGTMKELLKRLEDKLVKKAWNWYNRLSNQVRTSFAIAGASIGFVATIMTITGTSINAGVQNVWLSLLIVLVLLFLIALVTYSIISHIYKNSVKIEIRSMSVEISTGDIFTTPGFKVIGCDTHFDTRVDDRIVSKTSLHGQLILNHGNKDEIKKVVEEKAIAIGLEKNSDGLYEFPLGTIIRYDSSVDGQTYLMLALTEMKKTNGQYKAITSMAKYEETLHTLWEQIDNVYVYNDIVLPLLGTGAPKFEGGGKSKESLLRCILCTLNSSGVELTSKIRVVIYENTKDIPLFEFKNLFKTISRSFLYDVRDR